MILTEAFTSVQDFCERPQVVKAAQKIADEAFNAEYAAKYYAKDWFGPGITSLDQVRDAVEHGWTDGAERARGIMADLSASIPPARSIKRKRIQGDYGDTLDIQRVYCGRLDTAWTRTERKESNAAGGSNIIPLKVHIGGNSRRTGDDLFYQGASATILADILEEAGYRVEITAYHYSHDTGRTDNTSYDSYSQITIKAASEPLDFDRLITVTALAGFSRYYGFKYSMSHKEIKRYDTGLGNSIIIMPEEFKEANQILIGGAYTKEDAIKQIKDALKAFN